MHFIFSQLPLRRTLVLMNHYSAKFHQLYYCITAHYSGNLLGTCYNHSLYEFINSVITLILKCFPLVLLQTNFFAEYCNISKQIFLVVICFACIPVIVPSWCNTHLYFRRSKKRRMCKGNDAARRLDCAHIQW